MSNRLPLNFFQQGALELAPGLLGKILVRQYEDGRIERYRINETEAYCGIQDLAFFLIAALPLVIVYISPATDVIAATPAIASIPEITILVVISAATGLLFERLKVPAGLILGAALASAALGFGDVIHGGAPDSILIPANIILGVMIALRFKGISLPELRSALGDGFAGFAIAMVIAVAGALFTSQIAGLPLALTLLAFAPGGLEAMTIMAFALNLDPAYVAAHQVARYIGLVLLMPVVTSFVLHRTVPAAQPVNVEDD
jgi:membrane AbrB-like protein